MSSGEKFPKRTLELVPFNSQLLIISSALSSMSKQQLLAQLLPQQQSYQQNFPRYNQQAQGQNHSQNQLQKKYASPGPALQQQKNYLLQQHQKQALQLSPQYQSSYQSQYQQQYGYQQSQYNQQTLQHQQQQQLANQQLAKQQASKPAYNAGSNFSDPSPILSFSNQTNASPYFSSLDFQNGSLDSPRFISSINKPATKIHPGNHASQTTSFANYGEVIDSPILLPPNSNLTSKNSPPNLFLSSNGSSPLKSPSNASTPTETNANKQFLDSPSLLASLPCANNNWNTSSTSIWGNSANANSSIVSSLGSTMW